MRTILLTLTVTLALAARGAAQSAPPPPPPASTSGANPSDTELAPGLVSEPAILTRAIDLAGGVGDRTRRQKDGFYPDLTGMITGAGWISAGPGYRHHLLNGHALFDGSAAISWRAYKKAQARFELPNLANDHLTLGVQGRWQDLTQIHYFGLGPDSLESSESEYRLKDTDVLGYGNLRATRWLTVGGRFGWLRRGTLEGPSGPFDPDFPDARQVFPADPGMAGLPSYLHGDLSVTIDTRNHPSHPTAGGVYRAVAGMYSDRDFAAFSFRRYEAEALQIVPIAGKTWTLAFHGWGIFSDTSPGNQVPFDMVPSLGGSYTLRGYHNYRFHDRNLLLASAESRWALMSHVDVAAFFDAGNVAARFGDLNLDKTSVGAGVRVHTGRSTLARADVAHSREGWRVIFSLDDPFRLQRRNERAVIAPFVP